MAASGLVYGAGGKKDLLTVLQDYIKQQERRKSHSSMNEDGFIIVVKESVWTSLFGEYFMSLDPDEEVIPQNEDDDMLFYVRCNPRKTGDEVFVFRKESKSNPGLGDPHINWEETVYLNLIMHHMEYDLTCAVCTRLPSRDMKVVKKASVKIYASPHARRMDSKGEESSQSYPNLFFMIDTYDEVFGSLCVGEDEMVCVELVAKHKENGSKAVIFLGSVTYEALKKVYDSKGSFGMKVAQKMSLGWLSNDQDHTEFIKMKGPHGKGFAEMAIRQYKPSENDNVSNALEHTCHCQGSDESGSSGRNSICPKCGHRKNHGGAAPLSSFKWMGHRKKTSSLLSTQLTYVNLPWSRIMKDLLEVRQSPLFSK
ncbi:uncharacterized protein KIAA0930 homolog [Rhopilema esculentum]|uniref:uncharacterized protein KIAA0930 homolog n=1 Tax=Rhopilema esculentum TaxID=499914 RepID=UPI0031DB76BA